MTSNNREIKFRAWHKNREEWVDLDDHFSFDTEGALYQTDFKPIVLMQYTGLKDKNGKEIYEGDMVDRGFGGMPFLVEWREEWCGFFFDDGDSLAKTETNTYEVIGNIWENPDLLK